jgi:hypothetical protein
VTLGAAGGHFGEAPVPPITHTWSFSTGKSNPLGNWTEGEEPTSATRTEKARQRVKASYARGHVIITGTGFEAGAVTVRKQQIAKRPGKKPKLGKVLARARAGRPGRFVARFRWPRTRPVTVRVIQGKTSLAATYRPKGRRGKRPSRKHAKRPRHAGRRDPG